MKETKEMIVNRTDFPMSDIYEYLSGITTKLRDKVKTFREAGQYYDTIYIYTI